MSFLGNIFSSSTSNSSRKDEKNEGYKTLPDVSLPSERKPEQKQYGTYIGHDDPEPPSDGPFGLLSVHEITKRGEVKTTVLLPDQSTISHPEEKQLSVGIDMKGGSKTFVTGKYTGKTYEYVEMNDQGYCRRIITAKGRHQGDFRRWLLQSGYKEGKRGKPSEICAKPSPELKQFVEKVKRTPPTKLYDPGVLLGEKGKMQRYGWFIDYIVRYAVFLECKKVGVPVNDFTCQTRARINIKTSLDTLTMVRSSITTDDTLRNLWVISFSSVLSYNGNAVDIPMPDYDVNMIRKIEIFARCVASQALSHKHHVNTSVPLSGKNLSGEADIIAGDCIVDIKFSMKNPLTNPRCWIQVLIYAMMRIDQGFDVHDVAIYDVNNGMMKFVSVTEEDLKNVRTFVNRVTSVM